MKKPIFLFALALLIAACDGSTSTIEFNGEAAILPAPKKIHTSSKALVLSASSELFTEDESLKPLLSLFQNEIELLTGKNLPIGTKASKNADLVFELDDQMEKEAYSITVDDKIVARGGSYQALAMAKTSLLQLAFVENGQLAFPVLNINDQPDVHYRGLMIDLARNWHEVSTIKKLIDLAAFYKSSYVHLHFTDYQSYTLPSRAYPKLSTPDRHYSFEELKDLEAYASLRGITLIPEIDIPGHASSIVKAYPEIFGIEAIDENPWTVNMGKEEVYEALAAIFGEITPIFKSTPIIHIGGDEAIFHKLPEDPNVQAFMKEHELGDDIHELYRYFLVRMNDLIKSHGKQMAVWEGFRRNGEVPIPKDILVYEFETNRYLPNHLVEDGYTVINTSWKPLYVVNQKKWEPKTIYGWNIWRWENWFRKAPSIIPIQLEPTNLIQGAQMCAWEQAAEKEIPSLRKRLPALNERIWNTNQKLSYEDFMRIMNEKDQQLSLLINDSRQDSLLLGHNFQD